MEEESWFGPWCSYHAVVVKDKSVIVDEVHQFRRHVYEDGVFKTEKIDIDNWQKLGYKYNQLPEGSLK